MLSLQQQVWKELADNAPKWHTLMKYVEKKYCEAQEAIINVQEAHNHDKKCPEIIKLQESIDKYGFPSSWTCVTEINGHPIYSATALGGHFRHLVVHCQKSKYDVYVGRTWGKMGLWGEWGNPFHMQYRSELERQRVIKEYRLWLLNQPKLIKKVREELCGKKLACWCVPKDCHGHFLAEVANSKEGDVLSNNQDNFITVNGNGFMANLNDIHNENYKWFFGISGGNSDKKIIFPYPCAIESDGTHKTPFFQVKSITNDEGEHVSYKVSAWASENGEPVDGKMITAIWGSLLRIIIENPKEMFTFRGTSVDNKLIKEWVEKLKKTEKLPVRLVNKEWYEKI